MIKEERLEIILQEINEKGIVKVTDLFDLLNVSEMTIRRDLTELEVRGDIIKVHGGARKTELTKSSEISHFKKQEINLTNKQVIAQKIASVIKTGDVIFLGAGTTIEFVSDFLDVYKLKIITNALPLFQKLILDERFETILIGGSYRPYTGSFVGSFSVEMLQKIKVQKAFIGVNAINEGLVHCYNEEEGLTHKIVLKNAEETYLISDSSKLDKTDFYMFYNLEDTDYLISDDEISPEQYEKYSNYTRVL